MSRIFGLILSLGLLMGVTSDPAQALGPMDGARMILTPHQSLIVQIHGTKGKPSTEKQKCLALNRCRYKYTRCYNKLVAEHKSIDTEKITCVKPYQKCINASFAGFDFFLTRWFNPEVDCSQF
jgi:hypothetical protein